MTINFGFHCVSCLSQGPCHSVSFSFGQRDGTLGCLLSAPMPVTQSLLARLLVEVQHVAFHSRVWHFTVVCCISQSCVAFNSRVWHFTFVCCILQSCVAFHSRVWHFTVVCCILQSCVAFHSRPWHACWGRCSLGRGCDV